MGGSGFWAKFWQYLPHFLDVLLPAALTTIKITAGAFGVAAAAGLLLAVVGTLPLPPVRALVRLYVEVIRGTPVLAQLFILYFGLSEVGLRFSPFEAAVLGLGGNGAAYLSEVFRAGIAAVPVGQREAALTVGLTPLQALRHIVLPQAIRIVVPPVANYSIGLLKDTAVVSAVAAPEIMFRARNLVMETYLSMQIYLLVALIYLALSLTLATIAARLERRFAVAR